MLAVNWATVVNGGKDFEKQRVHYVDERDIIKLVISHDETQIETFTIHEL